MDFNKNNKKTIFNLKPKELSLIVFTYHLWRQLIKYFNKPLNSHFIDSAQNWTNSLKTNLIQFRIDGNHFINQKLNIFYKFCKLIQRNKFWVTNTQLSKICKVVWAKWDSWVINLYLIYYINFIFKIIVLILLFVYYFDS